MDVSHLEPSELGYLESQGYTHRDLELLDPIEVGFLIPEMTNDEKLFYTGFYAGLALEANRKAEAENQRAKKREIELLDKKAIERERAYKQSLADIYELRERQEENWRVFNICSGIALGVCIALTVMDFIGK